MKIDKQEKDNRFTKDMLTDDFVIRKLNDYLNMRKRKDDYYSFVMIINKETGEITWATFSWEELGDAYEDFKANHKVFNTRTNVYYVYGFGRYNQEAEKIIVYEMDALETL